jgi:hypothetical protein
MVRLWDAKRGERAWPLRSDLDPIEFRFVLGYVSLIDVHSYPAGQPRRFFFRVDGTKQVALFGIDCTGKFLDQIVLPSGMHAALESFNTAVVSGDPQYRARSIEFHERLLNYEIVVLPLSRRGTAIDMLMTVVLPEDK